MYKERNTNRHKQCKLFNNDWLPLRSLTKHIVIYFVLSLVSITSTVAVQRVSLPEEDRLYLIEIIMQTHTEIATDRAEELAYELENFYTGVRDNLWTNCGPPSEIDKAFHLHIINTRLYAAFSEATFGRFLHHSPLWSRHRASHDLLERCGHLMNTLKDHGVLIKYEDLWGLSRCEAQKTSAKHRPVFYCVL